MMGAQAFERQWAEIGDDVLAAVSEVGASGWYIQGERLRLFEAALAKTCGRAFAAGCGNGLDAIEIALRCLGLRAGEPVLTTPMSAFATTLAIHRAGGKAVFVDVDASGQLDLELARHCLEAHPEIRFCVPVHLYGHCLDLPALRRLREDFDLEIVEDGAQAIGAGWGEEVVGDVGRILATSFYPTKNLGAMGDGGALLTDSPALAESARSLRDYGQTSKYVHAVMGLNSRLDEMQAAILLRAMLPRLPGWTARRREHAERYLGGLSNSWVRPLPVPSGSRSVWHLFPVEVVDGQRDALLAYLRSQQVMAHIHYPLTIPDQPALQGSAELMTCFDPLPRARALAANELSLPITPDLGAHEVDRVIEVVNAWRP